VTLIALGCGWAIWQPVVADRALARSYELTGNGDPVAGLREAADARDLDPHSIEPFYAAATALIAIGHQRQAIASLRRAAAERPRDPEPWLRVAALQLEGRNAPAAALAAARQALRRDPHSRQAIVLYENSRRLLDERRAAAAAASVTTTP
jgi:tetratricopeptide (TPR) repeat protein